MISSFPSIQSSVNPDNRLLNEALLRTLMKSLMAGYVWSISLLSEHNFQSLKTGLIRRTNSFKHRTSLQKESSFRPGVKAES